jgi:hypothetical protein
MERMRELRRREVPLVLISHNLPVVQDLCSRAIVVDRGTVRFDGDPARAIQEYRRVPWADSDPEHPPQSAVWIARVELLDEDGQSSAMFRTMGSMRIRVHYETRKPVRNAAIAVDIHRGDGIYCAGVSTVADRCNPEVLEGVGQVDVVFPNLALLPGCYLGSVKILDGAGRPPHDRRERAYPFTIVSDRRDAGVVYLDHGWTHQQSTPAVAEKPRPVSYMGTT